MLSEADQAIRRRRITSSSVAAVLGVDPYTTPLKAWARITGEDDPQPSDAAAARMQRGHLLEPALLDYAAGRMRELMDARDVEVIKPPTMVCPHGAWAADSVDAILQIKYHDGTSERVGVEAKTVSGDTAWLWGEDLTYDVPRHVELQSIWHAWCHGLDLVAVPVLLGPQLELRTLFVRPSQEEIESVTARAREWWHRHVEANTPPEPSGSEDLSLMERLFKASPGSVFNDPKGEILGELAHRLASARLDKKIAKAMEDEARFAIANILRSHDSAVGPWGSLTWRENKGGKVVDWQGLARELMAGKTDAEVIEKIAAHTSIEPGSRQMRVKLRQETD